MVFVFLFSFLAFLVVGMVFILSMGILERERARAEATEDPSVQSRDLLPASGFLLPQRPRVPRAKGDSVEEAVVHSFQDYVRRERLMVGAFLSEPSVENLHRSDVERIAQVR